MWVWVVRPSAPVRTARDGFISLAEWHGVASCGLAGRLKPLGADRGLYSFPEHVRCTVLVSANIF